MIQLTPHMRILLAYEPADFRKGIDSLVALCKAQLKEDPFSGSLFVFRNKSRTAIKLLICESSEAWRDLIDVICNGLGQGRCFA